MELLKGRKSMKRIIITAIIINLFLVVSGCTKSRNDGDELHGDREHGKLSDRCDHRHRHGQMFVEKEFFDARDFHPDSLYGGNHRWRDEDYERFNDEECRHLQGGSHGRPYHHYGRSFRGGAYEDVLSERHLPPPVPDMKHDK
jgi:hypothetical protein